MYIKENNIKKAYEYKIKETKYKDIMSRKKIKKEVTEEDIADVISSKTGIPLYEIMKDNKKVINEIETNLKKEILGQNEAIEKLITIAKRIKLGYKENKCISLLFIGPSGVGKTKLATTFGNLISKQKVIKLDMSEYSDSSFISKFIGSAPGYVGYDDNKYILNTIKDSPNAVIILDEIDKAHPKIINLFYQILEDGKIKDAKNNIINFNNNIIIMTSNIGSERKNIGFNMNNTTINNSLKEVFNIALINRIDNIIKFNNLTEQDINKIIKKEINNLKQQYKDIKIDISNSIIDEITRESNYQEFGARKISKIIKDKLENLIIDNIIDNKKEINFDSLFTK